MSTVRHYCHQRGAAFVEAAILLPVVFLLTFVTIFFCLMAYRLFSLQMAANDVAQSISNAFSQGAPYGCTAGTDSTLATVDLATFRSGCYDTWRGQIARRYLIPSTDSMTIQVSGFARLPLMATPQTKILSGDIFVVLVTYSKTNILGGKVPLFGLLTGDLVASAAGFIERPQTR